jgi:hypothetical protein
MLYVYFDVAELGHQLTWGHWQAGSGPQHYSHNILDATDAANYDCAVMNYPGTGYWKDTVCSVQYAYVCQYGELMGTPYSGPLHISRNLPIRRKFRDRRHTGSLHGNP